jgi:hypothetical protein
MLQGGSVKDKRLNALYRKALNELLQLLIGQAVAPSIEPHDVQSDIACIERPLARGGFNISGRSTVDTTSRRHCRITRRGGRAGHSCRFHKSQRFAFFRRARRGAGKDNMRAQIGRDVPDFLS